MGALGGVPGAISRCEVVVGGVSGGWIRVPTVLRSTRDRRRTMEVALNLEVRDLRVRLGDRRGGKHRQDDRKQAIRRTVVCLGLICGPELGIVCE